MALPPSNDTQAPDDSFIREVDEEYRRDQLAQFWARWGRWILVGVGLFLVLLAAFLYWREERQRDAGLLGEEMVAALARIEASNPEGANATLSKAAQAPQDGYRAVGKMAQAALAARDADTKTAVALYGEVAADTSLPDPFRDLALLRQIMLQFDTLPPAQVIPRLKPLAQEGGPWFGTAGELLAIAYLRDGKPELAGPLFAALAKQDSVPAAIRGRAAQMASSLGLDPLPVETADGAGAPADKKVAE